MGNIIAFSILSVFSTIIFILGYLYVRNNTLKNQVQHSLDILNTLKINSFENKINELRKRDKSNINTDKIDKLQEDWNQSTVKDLKILIYDHKFLLEKMNDFVILPFKEIKKVVYPGQEFKDYRYKKWYEIRKPFYTIKKHIKYMEDTSEKIRSEILQIYFNYSNLNQANEIKHLSIKQIKESYRINKQIVNSSKIVEFRNNKKIKNKFDNIEARLEQIELTKDSISSDMFYNEISEMSSYIKKISKEISTIVYGYEIQSKVSSFANNIKKWYKSNKEILRTISGQLESRLKIIHERSEKLDSELKNLRNINNIEKFSKEILNEAAMAEGEIILNLHSESLVSKTHPTINKIIDEFDTKNNEIQTEIERHSIDSNGKKKFEISKSAENLKRAFNSYSTEKRKTYAQISPWSLLNQQIKVIEQYDQHKTTLDKFVKDIEDIVNTTDDINIEIAKANTFLLNAEYRLKYLPKERELLHSDKIDKGQIILQKLIKKYKGKKLDLDNQQEALEIKKFSKECERLLIRVTTDSFLSVYGREVIMILNKNKGINHKFDTNLDILLHKYKQGNFKYVLNNMESLLRKVK